MQHLVILLSAITAVARSWSTAALAPAATPAHRHQRSAAVVCRAKKGWARRLAPESPLAPGSVVASTPGSFDHYYLESLVLLIEHSEETGSVGVLLNHETPWTVGEMTGDTSTMGELMSENNLFLGGDAGRDTMLMVHSLPLLEGARPLGNTPLAIGGVREAVKLVSTGQLVASKFKFFYKTVEFLPGQLQLQREDGMFEHVELSPSLLLQQSGQRSMWHEVRQLMADAEREAFEAAGGVGDPLEIKGLPATRYAPSTARAAALAKEELAQKQEELEVLLLQQQQQPEEANEEEEEQKKQQQPAAMAQVAEPAGDSAIAAVVGYREFKGLQQYRVRWTGCGPEDDTWEALLVLEAEDSGGKLVAQAEAERRKANGYPA